MRNRLLIPLMAFAVLTVLALVVPAVATLARARTQELQLARVAAMSHIAQLSESAIATSDTGTLRRYLERFHLVYGESVIVVDASGSVLSAVGPLDPRDDVVQAYVLDALRDLPRTTVATILPWSPDQALLAEPVGSVGSTTIGAVVLQPDLRAARTDVLRSWLTSAGLAAALLVGLAAASQRWARWVLRPVRALDAAANAFPRRRELGAVRGGPPELRQLAASVTRMAQGLEDVLEQQRGFVADASHQLRNPLAAIRLRVDGLAADDDQQTDELSAVSSDVDRLQHIVDRMLVLATVEQRANALSMGVDTDVSKESRRDHTAPSAAALVEPFRALVAASGQSLHPVGSSEVRIACRRSDLEEILGNLLDNARKYAGRGATVTVRLQSSEELVAVIIEDDGPGLSQEELGQVGARFWRSTRNGDEPGSGLGLAIVRQLVLANDGSLELGSVDPSGLRVTLRFKAL